MTVCCASCKSPTTANSGSSPSPKISRSASLKRFRSTKGASKARRDQINGEIRSMRALLPIPLEDQERLSYLHSMSAICTFVRKSVFYQGLQPDEEASSTLPYEDFLQALPGFIVAMTGEGKLIYVSENVHEYLGYSMVDVLQGDTFFDMVENADVGTVKSHLRTDGTQATERSFVCQMHTSKAFRMTQGSGCSMLVAGRFLSQPGSSPPCPDHAFVALCTPTADRWRDDQAHWSVEPLRTIHKPDMSLTHVSENVLFHLGYSPEELIGRSWYSLLHPDDLPYGTSGHKNLLHEEEDVQLEMVLRLLHKDLSWMWLYIRAAKDSGKHAVNCANFIISETEAMFLREKICPDYKSALRSVLQCPSANDRTARPLKRQRESSPASQGPQDKAMRTSEPIRYYGSCPDRTCDRIPQSNSPVFPSTPPYSPSGSSDFLPDSYSYAEELLSPPRGSSPYPSHRGAIPGPLLGHFSPSGTPHAAAEHTFQLIGFPDVAALSPEPSACPPYDFPCHSSDARMVPDCRAVLDMGSCSPDCTSFHPDYFDLSNLPQEGASPLLAFQGGALLTPDPSPTVERQFQYSEEERVEISVLAGQISSLASSFDTYRDARLALPSTAPGFAGMLPNCDRDLAPEAALPQGFEPVLDEFVIDCILKELDAAPGKDTLPCSGPVPQAPRSATLLLGALMEDPPLESFGAAGTPPDSCITGSGCHRDNYELHQLSLYMHSSFQQDGLVEDSMY